MREALFIILGWLLGLLGAPILLRIEKYYKRKDLKIAIFSELKNLEIRLAATKGQTEIDPQKAPEENVDPNLTKLN